MASDRPLIRICIHVRPDDYDKARFVASARGVPVNRILRECIHDYILRLNDLERKAIDAIDAIKVPEAAQ